MADFDAATDFQIALAVRRGSPATTLRRSATSGSGRSRPKLTPVRWKPASLAPHTKSLIAATERSAKIATFCRRPQPARYSRACSRGIPRPRLRWQNGRATGRNFAGLDFIQFVIAAQQQQGETFAAIFLFADHGNRLDDLVEADRQGTRRHRRRPSCRGWHLFHRLPARGAVLPGQVPRPARRWRRNPSPDRRRCRPRRNRPARGIHASRCRRSSRCRPPPHGISGPGGEDAAVGGVHVAVFALQIRNEV
jgi:hypothetical protein